MPHPEFTTDEQYLLHVVRSPTFESGKTWMWGYLTGGLVLAGFAAYYNSISMLLSAFLVVCGFRIYEERIRSKAIPVWRSIIEKYDAALANAAASDSVDA